MNNEICETCGYPPHPNLPCNEVAILNGNYVDNDYFSLLQDILDHGRRKKNRTGIDTIGIFGAMAKFPVRMVAFPILTTKKVWFKGIVHELLWFLKGDTNIKYLVDNDVHIWDEWAYAKFKKDGWLGDIDYRNQIQSQEKFIERIKTLRADDWFVTKFGNLGEGTYGGMWRKFPTSHWERINDDGRERMSWESSTVDQIQKVMDKLKNNPDDRRMIVSAWHPYWVDHCALPPCHCLFHFNTEELTIEERLSFYANNLVKAAVKDGWNLEKIKESFKEEDDGVAHHLLDNMGIPRRRLNLLLYQRSCDTFLGVPFNISSYSLLLAMVAHCSGMVPGVFTHTYGDLHIYENHLDQVKEQMKRCPKKLPSLWLNPEKRNIFDFEYKDIQLKDYNPYPAIKAPIAV